MMSLVIMSSGYRILFTQSRAFSGLNILNDGWCLTDVQKSKSPLSIACRAFLGVI